MLVFEYEQGLVHGVVVHGYWYAGVVFVHVECIGV
jgi:hypothetical protein